MQLKLVLTFVAALVPLAVSTSVGKSCKSSEFRWEAKDCCLPQGGPPAPPPPPPPNKNCPPTSYYWEPKQSCCVPRHPPPPNPPPPQCPKGWEWNKYLYHCVHTPTPPAPPPSHPSGYPGNGNHHYKRSASHKARTTLCPTNLDACPVSTLSGDYECLDTTSELESCGGCTTLGQGQDCTKIEGAWNVGCNQGSCIVDSCAGGFRLNADRKSCVPL